jgi:predicted esterase
MKHLLFQRGNLLGITAFLALVVAGAAWAEEALPAAGAEATIIAPTSGKGVIIYTPANYQTNQPVPVVFFYHGMGGRPDTTFMRKLTGGRDYLVVGMPYLEDDSQRRTLQEQKNYMRRELAHFHAVREWLAAHARVDERRIFLAGISKGGWVVSALGELDLPRIGGLIVLLAGRPYYASYRRPVVGLPDKPIYLGTGESDPNNIPARRAREYYRRNGAVVTFEEYAGRGHDVPPDPPLLKAWLEVHGRYGAAPCPPAFRQELTAYFTNAIRTALAEADASSQYKALAGLAADPRLRLCEPQDLDELGKRLAALKSVSPLKEEWAAESAFNELLFQEASLSSLEEMKNVLAGFQNLAREHPQTRYGQMAAQFALKMEEAYRQSVAASGQAGDEVRPATNKPTSMKPSFPTGGSARQPLPVRQGKRVVVPQSSEK